MPPVPPVPPAEAAHLSDLEDAPRLTNVMRSFSARCHAAALPRAAAASAVDRQEGRNHYCSRHEGSVSRGTSLPHRNDVIDRSNGTVSTMTSAPARLRFQSILVVTYGRSGSTLLQGVLNSIDRCLIRGENYNFCYGLFRSYQSMMVAKKFTSSKSRSPWFGPKWDESLFLRATRTMVRDLLLGDVDPRTIDCYGFKEIRYTELHVPQLPEYLAFLAQIFPSVAYIFNTRDLDDVVRSDWWRRDPDRYRPLLNKTEEQFRSYAAAHDNCFLIDYRDIVGQSPALAAMFDFLGAPYDTEKITAVLAKRHGYRTPRYFILGSPD
jgi:Sulfotransferase family